MLLYSESVIEMRKGRSFQPTWWSSASPPQYKIHSLYLPQCTRSRCWTPAWNHFKEKWMLHTLIIHCLSFGIKKAAMICGYISGLFIYVCAEFVTYRAELLALISHLLPHRPALCSQAVPEVDAVDGWARLLVQRGHLANPVEDLPAQSPVVI